MIGFSAGAMTTLEAAFSSDPAARPDFVVSAYGALVTETAPHPGGPPLFIVTAQDDPQVPPVKAVEMFSRWNTAKVPAELHLYEKGGHGFGMRKHDHPSDGWPTALQAWLVSRGFIPNNRVTTK